MSGHGDQQDPSASDPGADRLLRAIDELRELEREKRQAPASSAPFMELARRVEAKAREVFRIAQDSDDEDDVEAARHEGSEADLHTEEDASRH